MTVARVITRPNADVVEQFELDGDVIVTVDRLAAVMHDVGMEGDPRKLAYDLQRGGWLGTLRSRNAWEFLPAARAGAYSSGDRFLEFRAQQALRPDWPGTLAMESSAALLGLAQRIPEREVVALGDDVVFPKAMSGQWRCVRIVMPPECLTQIDGLPSWDRECLIVGIGIRPSGYKDIAGLGQWLSVAPYQVDLPKIVELLAPASSAARQRTSYLLNASGNRAGAQQIIDIYPPTDTAWLGPRRQGGHYDPVTKVSDTLLHPYLSVGGGA
ncbi:hypothetical protein [Gordonia sp. (in: high G+C Gram-positive bacteria)]|jgi:hypothetical protein|uniref:hypothetical protein n=1 Tax=Gordonia sp. (in: high G+C Gram-positive bacteria) TaxID=84139 RepID=UPI001D5F75B3|nr:hypothetical protein [Gordonia sp. (in: high G+C Gram-positive bacteria)]MCB1296760.1 hypothetical protein [Gordonia sp. (in: high G+C Gram-positive bacteria)]HMS74680.1 hypothetical protein [Gordonia sp. (in: high G+C Gram-positive bacteria)]HQV17648.1 hypothetical protein [Gordonia sp. (in: high G+C Gram-positive bacteria)]